MPNYLVLKDGVVVNRAVFEGPRPDGDGLAYIADTGEGDIGWRMDAGVLVPPAAAVPVVISRRQLAGAAAVLGHLTQDEAVAWAGSGTIPAAVVTAIDQIPDPNEKFSARLAVASAVDVRRSHTVTTFVASALGLTSDELDEVFRLGVTLD